MTVQPAGGYFADALVSRKSTSLFGRQRLDFFVLVVETATATASGVSDRGEWSSLPLAGWPPGIF